MERHPGSAPPGGGNRLTSVALSGVRGLRSEVLRSVNRVGVVALAPIAQGVGEVDAVDEVVVIDVDHRVLQRAITQEGEVSWGGQTTDRGFGWFGHQSRDGMSTSSRSAQS